MTGFNFSIGLSGLKAAQIGMDVTSHNIANVNTPDFQRQLMLLKNVSFNSTLNSTSSGAGVAVSDIINVNDPFLLKQYPSALSNSSEYAQLNELSKPFNELLNNPALNLSTAMQETFNAFQDVANTPTSIPIRQNAIDKAQSLVDKSSVLLTELNSLKNNLANNETQSVDSINTIVKSISEVNKQLQYSGENINASLISQRDSLTFQLSQLTGIDISLNKQNITTTSGVPLLSNGINIQTIQEKDIINIKGGKIGGTNSFISTILSPAIEKLPNIINQFATKINEQNQIGFDLNGNIGQSIFKIDTNQLSLTINDPKILAASSFQNSIGDGTNAQKISDLKNTLFNGQTLQSQYSGLVSNIDSKIKNYSNMNDLYDSITNNISNQIKSISGVNLDEEAANLLKYKRMYEANAQVIKTQNEMFGTLINIKV